jgi:hypothetical protein
MARTVFLSDKQRGRSNLVPDLDNTVNTALFGLFRIQSILKKVANCELVHCQDAREHPSMFF